MCGEKCKTKQRLGESNTAPGNGNPETAQLFSSENAQGQQRHPILIDMLRSFDEPLAMAIIDTRIYQPRPLVNCPMHNLRSRFHICCVAASQQPAQQTHTHTHSLGLEFLGERQVDGGC